MNRLRLIVFLPAVAVLTVAGTGCGWLALFGRGMGLGSRPAEYPGLDNQRVAVVCSMSNRVFGDTDDSVAIATAIGRQLQTRLPGVAIVPPHEIADWKDRHDWNGIDYVKLGRGVKANRLLAIEIDGYQLRGDATHYRGRAEVSMRVYDLDNGGRVVHDGHPTTIEFPKLGIVATTEQSENQFRNRFIRYLAVVAARPFHPVEAQETVAADHEFLRD